MTKVCVVIASRANYGRIKSVLDAINKNNQLTLQIVVAATALLDKYGKVSEIIKKDGFSIDAEAFYVLDGENTITMSKSTGLAIIELTTIFNYLKPDIVLTVADRFETMATAIAATYLNIKLAHTQGGEVTGSIDESVRHAITKLAHIHFPATSQSMERLIKMGENPNFIFNTGCPAIDCLININYDLTYFNKRNIGVGFSIDFSKPYLLVVLHPVTSEHDEALSQVLITLDAINDMNMQTIWLWPNVDAGSDKISKGLRNFRENNPNSKVCFVKNFTVEDYAIILKNSKCAIGNSSSFIREGSFLGTPAVLTGTRQKNRERGQNVKEVNFSKEEIINAINFQINHGSYSSSNIFGDGNAGTKIANILATINPPIQKNITY